MCEGGKIHRLIRKIYIKRKRYKYYYDFVEQHPDGSWWYHGAWEDNNHGTREKAENNFKERLWWDPERPYRILRHRDKFPNVTLISKDLKVFKGLQGEIIVDGEFEVLTPERLKTT